MLQVALGVSVKVWIVALVLVELGVLLVLGNVRWLLQISVIVTDLVAVLLASRRASSWLAASFIEVPRVLLMFWKVGLWLQLILVSRELVA